VARNEKRALGDLMAQMTESPVDCERKEAMPVRLRERSADDHSDEEERCRND
jgi:hypothetical protein